MALPWLEGVIVLFHKEGKTLLMDYRDYPHKIHEGKIAPSSGTIEAAKGDKSSSDTGVRESMEELNIIVHDLVYHGKVNFNNERRTVNGRPMKFNMRVDLYDCFNFDDSHMRATEERDGRRACSLWVPDSEIMGIKELHEGDRRMFKWLNQYSLFEGTIVQDGERLVESETRIIGYSPTQLSA